jgi:hypothetical protein
MTMSLETAAAVEIIKRDLSISISLDYEDGGFYDRPSIRVDVRLKFQDETISESSSFASLPDLEKRK